jgi:uncharacterized protein YndB with AHSA1/START domain
MSEKLLTKTVQVPASPAEVWRAWTTVEGIRTFFAPDAKLEIKPGGPFEVYFGDEEPEGEKGSEGCRVLSYVPLRMLSFTWGAPPQYQRSRREIAQWVVVFMEASGDGTLVTLFELGWKDDDEGRAVYQYFDRAWTTVLARLAYSFSSGPMDWKNPYRPPPAPGR